jgi:hypothetical protein
MTLEDLGRRAVACKHWLFLPGTRIVGHNTMGRHMSLRLLNIPGSAWPEFWVAETRNANEVSFMKGVEEAGFLPDLSDPATLGCLVALVREAWKGNVAPVYPDSDEALTKLVAALEAAP